MIGLGIKNRIAHLNLRLETHSIPESHHFIFERYPVVREMIGLYEFPDHGLEFPVMAACLGFFLEQFKRYLVAGAPPNKEGDGPDRSMADFFWCMMAAQRGSSIEE